MQGILCESEISKVGLLGLGLPFRHALQCPFHMESRKQGHAREHAASTSGNTFVK